MTQCTNYQKTTQKDDILRERDLVYKDSFSASDYYDDLYNSAEMKYAFKGTTPEEVEVWQTEFRDKLKERLGISQLENGNCLHLKLKPEKSVLKISDTLLERDGKYGLNRLSLCRLCFYYLKIRKESYL